jgi:hypothetical protein
VIYNNLIILLNGKHFRNIGSADAQQVKDTLQRLPSNLNKRTEYRDKSINRILKVGIPSAHLMSIKTINTVLGCYLENFNRLSIII